MAEKKFPLYIPFIMIMIVVLLCREDFQSKEEKITTFIVKNQEVLTNMVSEALINGPDSLSLLDGINAINFWSGDDTMIEFKYYSIGIGNKIGTHYGFYYSPEDIPAAYGANGCELFAEKNGWFWYGEDNSSGFTKKIIDNWYYYETSF